jgi:hypothetical protein
MVGAMDSPRIRQLRNEWRPITQVLIPSILAGYEDELFERVFPCLPLDLFMRCPWIARGAVPTGIETPA